MIYNFYDDIKSDCYKDLIDFLVERCDVFTFMFPQYHCCFLTKENFDMVNDGKHSIGDKFYDSCGTELEEEEKLYQEYMNKNKHLLESLTPYFIRTVETACYGGQITGYLCTAYVYKLCRESAEILKKQKSLFSWQRECSSVRPLPCDLCFYHKGITVMETVAHENLGRIFLEKEDVQAIKRIGVKAEKSVNQYEAERCDYAIL